MKTARKRQVLISGASVAGPTLAYWLVRHGFGVTIVEKAPAVRSGGYPIDVRGTALDVIRRMGAYSRVAAAHIDTRRLTFVGGDGRRIGALRPESLTGGVEGRDLELPRGALTALLYDLVRDDCEFLFNDTITGLEEHDDGVDVQLGGGQRRRFDLVVGADGLHSNTRRLAFGPEADYEHYLGFCFAGFTIPNELGLAHEGISFNTPGKAAVLFAAGDSDRLHAFLIFAWPRPPFAEHPDLAAQRELVARVFADGRWQVPRMLAGLRAADDVFFDVTSQIHLPRWHSGRVCLVGDAAHAPSFLSGQGSSLALVGAYVLAGELAAHVDHAAAFAAYERVMRPFVTMNQALASAGAASLVPRTAVSLWMRNQMIRLAPLLARTGLFGRQGRKANSALALPAYAG